MWTQLYIYLEVEEGDEILSELVGEMFEGGTDNASMVNE